MHNDSKELVGGMQKVIIFCLVSFRGNSSKKYLCKDDME
jgi:hypothetical protein